VPTRPVGIQLLAVLLSCYAMGGFALALRMVGDRDPRIRWQLVGAAGAAFAVSAGVAALSVWRLERRSPPALIVCGVLGAALCLAIPAAAPPAVVTRQTWWASAGGGALFVGFLLLTAWYVRRELRARA